MIIKDPSRVFISKTELPIDQLVDTILLHCAKNIMKFQVFRTNSASYDSKCLA